MALAFLPALVLGVWLGSRSFRTADPARFRKIAERTTIAAPLDYQFKWIA
jgi:hypothetical protein